MMTLALVGAGLLLKAPGTRGLALPSQHDEALQLLAGLGYDLPPARAVAIAVTNRALLAMVPIDYLPSQPAGGEYGGIGRAQNTGQQSGKHAGGRAG